MLIARALAVDAPILLLDEPTTHLDPPHQIALVQLLRRRAAHGVTVISVLHDLALALLADRLVVLDRGRLRAVGSSDAPALHANGDEQPLAASWPAAIGHGRYIALG